MPNPAFSKPTEASEAAADGVSWLVNNGGGAVLLVIGGWERPGQRKSRGKPRFAWSQIYVIQYGLAIANP
jgi:hypothetical protein